MQGHRIMGMQGHCIMGMQGHCIMGGKLVVPDLNYFAQQYTLLSCFTTHQLVS